MKFFIDTAELAEIEDLAATGLLDGVTTNPSLIHKAGGELFETIDRICQIVTGPVSAEVTATEADYFGRLSKGSVRSLEVQGGPFDAKAAVAFIKQPHAEDGVQLRRWDEEAKDVNAVTPPLEHFHGYGESALR